MEKEERMEILEELRDDFDIIINKVNHADCHNVGCKECPFGITGSRLDGVDICTYVMRIADAIAENK